jgi:hypothetical protein
LPNDRSHRRRASDVRYEDKPLNRCPVQSAG